MSTQQIDLPERTVRLRDGRSLRLRHARFGDETGIARLITAAFPIYRRAAQGDAGRAIRSFARELRPQSFVVGVLVESDRIIGVSCITGRRGDRMGAVRRIRTKIGCWGVAGLLCFLREKVRSRLFEARHHTQPGELYRSLDAVDAAHRSLGVGRHIADFVDDYARAAGHYRVLARHHSDNLPVLQLHRKRGCVLVDRPATPLARLLRRPHMVVSSRALRP